MNRLLLYTVLLPLWVSAFPRFSAQTPPAEAVVRAVLFYSPTCGHCRLVINNTLAPLFEQYGDQLSMVSINITQSAGQALFQTALQYFNVETKGVPFLVIGDTYLIGSIQIPQEFPGMVEAYLAQGGTDWPAIPGLLEAMATAEAAATSAVGTPATASALATNAPTPTPGIQLVSEEQSGLGARFANDLVGNWLAVFVLAGMLVSAGGAALAWRAEPRDGISGEAVSSTWRWLIPTLCLVGLGVAGYLTYVETSQVEAVCGPVGDCITVQQSEYARLFGLLPIGILGVAGYILILLAWAGARFGQGRLAAYGSLALLGLAGLGVLFSIYLTFLEPFVIGATCAWCLASAIIMTALLWSSLAPAKSAFVSLRKLRTNNR
jgi:uncharacterized membrane protein/thiol-disulfide isomerase/thioredoxin